MFAKLRKKVRLLINRHKEPYLFLYRLLGFFPDNLELYRQALIHKSSNLGKDYFKKKDNERMEFLGDAVLDAIVTDYLYKKFVNKQEGYLSAMRSKIVQRTSLERVAAELGIDKLLVFSHGRGVLEKHIFGNALEALIAAVYLDQGYEVCSKFVENEIINKHINLKDLDLKELNHKSKLIEWGDKNKIKIGFEVMESYNNKRKGKAFFRSAVVVGGEQVGYGIGGNRRDSERKASEYVLLKISEDESFRKRIIELGKQANGSAADSASQTPDESSGDSE